MGITGFGFMGKTHLRCYNELDGVTVAAICDAEQSRLEDTGETAGNIEGAQGAIDLSDVHFYTDFEKMLAEENLDAVSIALPTFLHAEYTIKALDAGVNVLCEKPMALNVAQGEEMIAAAKKSDKVLQIGHCIRFWPEYAKTRHLVVSGGYGVVRAAHFRRISAVPKWSWNDWLTISDKSGGAIIDLHIHDTDYIQFVFGVPRAVRCSGLSGPGGGFDYVATQYVYDDEKVVTAEGGFVTTPKFPFEMSFTISLEKATISYDCARQPAFRLYSHDSEMEAPEVEAGDGWSNEIAHFVKSITGQQIAEIITPQQSLNAVKLVLAEKQSAQSRKEVPIQWSNVSIGR